MLSSIVLSAALASMVASASKFDDRVGYRRATPESMLFKRQAAQLNLPAGVDLGSCTDPTMIFAQGLEGRTETTFQPNNLDEFNHGAAQNQNIITQFICDTFVNNCGANDAALDLCEQAEAAVSGDDKVGATADKFNEFFGATTNFASVQAFDDQGNAVGGVADSGAAATQVVEETVDCSSGAAAAAASTEAAEASDANASTEAAAASATDTAAAAATDGENLQTFTGDLGGAAPAVTAGGRGFIVEGNDEFVGSGAALGRSCDVQHNACADEANSGGAFSVGDCDAQNNECRAAIN